MTEHLLSPRHPAPWVGQHLKRVAHIAVCSKCLGSIPPMEKKAGCNQLLLAHRRLLGPQRESEPWRLSPPSIRALKPLPSRNFENKQFKAASELYECIFTNPSHDRLELP